MKNLVIFFSKKEAKLFEFTLEKKNPDHKLQQLISEQFTINIFTETLFDIFNIFKHCLEGCLKSWLCHRTYGDK
jgi:hypothetical protein